MRRYLPNTTNYTNRICRLSIGKRNRHILAATSVSEYLLYQDYDTYNADIEIICLLAEKDSLSWGGRGPCTPPRFQLSHRRRCKTSVKNIWQTSIIRMRSTYDRILHEICVKLRHLRHMGPHPFFRFGNDLTISPGRLHTFPA